MRLAGKPLLWSYIGNATVGQKADITSWVAEVEAAQWLCSADVQSQFPNARPSGDIWQFALVPSGVVIVARLLFRNDQAIVRDVF
jgi:hypothetical protein